MNSTTDNKLKKHICIGILAHVDAGKTTLSEAMLYLGGSIRKMGRVDNGDAFLDTYELERSRGITIFSKQAVLKLPDTQITLLDTPGHVDFSAEMERTLQVLDYGVLVINGAEGVQAHTLTLWKLLAKYKIPVFLFLNKMDQNRADKNMLMEELRIRLGEGFVDFTGTLEEDFYEQVALCDDAVLERFLESDTVEEQDIKNMIRERKLFPCYFGSALKMEGVEQLIQGLGRYTDMRHYPEEFGAKVFKIARDGQGSRLTYMKITGGRLKVRDTLTDAQEKVNQIRIYSGEKFQSVNEAEAGCICAVTGLTRTYPGEGLGIETASGMPLLMPVMTCQLILPPGCDAGVTLGKLRRLEEEQPELHILWNDRLQEIQVQIMGEIQIEILKSLIWERFNLPVEFGPGNIVYKETIADCVEGVGHFEPLRHYAEVQLLLEPLEPGSGIRVETGCSENELDRNWQRLILTHLREKEHIGVLTGSAITDIKITLTAGRAHVKHTEGGDFRQAAYRAVRQGLRQARPVLLEPYYRFRLEIPEAVTGRAMTDIERMHGTFKMQPPSGELAVLTGAAPAVTMQGYQKEVTAYTKGMGRLLCTVKGYEPCHNTEEVTARIGYDADRDLDNPSGSVFCAHGSGFFVEWDQVKEYMHIESRFSQNAKSRDEDSAVPVKAVSISDEWMDTEEVDQILLRAGHANKKNKDRSRYGALKKSRPDMPPVTRTYKKPEQKQEYLLVDGYNIIYAWDELKKLAEETVDGARGRLMDILCNYQAIKKCSLILVFDAYRVKGHMTEITEYHNIHVVYTKEAETADQYIEKFAHENGRKYHITVATSDALEQMIVRGQDCSLLSARELEEEIRRAGERIFEEYQSRKADGRNSLIGALSDKAAGQLEKLKEGIK